MMEKVVRHADEGQQRRLVWVQIVLCAVGLLLVGRLAWYQLFGRIAAITQSPEVIAAVRGSILDINGHYLATSTYACNVFFRPDNYDKPDEQARLRERLAVTATVVAGGMTFEEGEMPQGFVERLAEQLIDPKTGAPRALAGKLADTLADRELLTMSLVEEMSAARSGRAADLRAQALAAGGAMDNSMAAMLSEILNEPLNDMERIVAGSRNQRHTVSVGVAESQCRAIADLGTDILITEFDFQRIYPDGSLASHILGFVNFAGEPQYGLEFYYDSELSGENGLWQGINHPSGSRLMAELGGYREAEDGSDLILSLDRNVQYEAERILRETVVSSEAESGSLLVLDSRTGAVIAMANSPTFEPGRFWDVGLETLRNGAISTIYEPGSVIKPLTIAAALDARVIYPDTTYMDEGVIIVGEQEVRNSDLKAHGETSMTELLAYSLNVGAAHVASILGPARFYEMFKREPVGKYLVNICTNISCQIMGGEELLHHAEHKLGIKAGSTTPDGNFTIEDVECIAACTEAPCLQVNYRYFHKITTDEFDELVDDLASGKRSDEIPPHGTLARIRQHIPADRAAGPADPKNTPEPAWLAKNATGEDAGS